MLICDSTFFELSIIVEEIIFGKLIEIEDKEKFTHTTKKQILTDYFFQMKQWISISFIGIVLSIILPGLGLVGSLAYLFYSQCFNSGEFSISYVLDRKGIDKTKFEKEHLGLYYGLGTGYLILFMIPVIGCIIASSLTTISGAIATLYTLKKEE
eukprot:gene8472-294_t